MKKTLVALIVVVGMLAGTATVASASPPDNKLVLETTCNFGAGPITLETRIPNQRAVFVQGATLVTGQTELGVGIVFDDVTEKGRGKALVANRGFIDRVVVCMVDLTPIGGPDAVPVPIKVTGQVAKNLNL